MESNIGKLSDKEKRMIAKMLGAYMREQEEWFDSEEQEADPEGTMEDAQSVFALWDHFKDCMNCFPGDKEGIEEFTIPYIQMFADGTKVYPVD